MKADVCALLKLSKQHSPCSKSIKSGKTQCESEMHYNARASFVAAVFFTKSKSWMLEVACLEMCVCRDCVRGNPFFDRGPVRFTQLQSSWKKAFMRLSWKIPKLSSEQVQLLNFKDISVRNKRSFYMIFNLHPLKYCLLKLNSNSCQGLKRNWNDFFFCFQKLAIQIVNLFHSSR